MQLLQKAIAEEERFIKNLHPVPGIGIKKAFFWRQKQDDHPVWRKPATVYSS